MIQICAEVHFSLLATAQPKGSRLMNVCLASLIHSSGTFSWPAQNAKTNETLLVSLRGSVMKLCTSQYHVIRCVQLLCFLNFYIFWIFSRQICHIELLWTPMNSCTSLSAMAFKRPSSQLCSSFADLPTTTHMLTNHHLFCLFSRIEEHLNHFESFLFIS